MKGNANASFEEFSPYSKTWLDLFPRYETEIPAICFIAYEPVVMQPPSPHSQISSRREDFVSDEIAWTIRNRSSSFESEVWGIPTALCSVFFPSLCSSDTVVLRYKRMARYNCMIFKCRSPLTRRRRYDKCFCRWFRRWYTWAVREGRFQSQCAL